MRRSRRRVGLCSYLLPFTCAAALLRAAPAPAQDAQPREAPPAVDVPGEDTAVNAQQKAAAEALFDEGRQLLAQGQYESACRKFEQSDAIDHGVGVLLYLGECYERSGRTASAWAIFREANSRAKAAGQLERAKLAEERARRLSASLSKLVLLVPQSNRVPGYELLLNGRPVSPALFGVPFPIDAGQHEVTARAPGRQPWSNIIEVKANGDFRNVQVPPLAESRVSPEAASPAAAPYPAGLTPGSESGQLSASGSSGPRRDLLPVYLLGGVGVVALGVGAIFGVRASDKDDQAKPFCPSDCRTRQAADTNEAARTSALVANISYGVGAAALITSAYLFFTTGFGTESAARAESSWQLEGSVLPRGGFVSVSGGF